MSLTPYILQTILVKALQGLGMLNVSVVLWVQGFSEYKWFSDSDEGVSPNKTEDKRENNELQE